MTTIRKVAKDADVSIATVSRVLNNLPGVSDPVRSRVLESVNRCGYVATVGKRATSYLGLMYTGPATLESPYDAALLCGLGSAVDESSLDLALVNLHRDKRPNETFTQFFLRKGVRGVIMRTTDRTRFICEQIAAEGFPALVVGDRFDFNENISSVYCDSRSTSYQGVEHLIALGHRRIALAISDVQDTDHADRQLGYEKALTDNGIELDRKLYFHVPAHRPDGAQIIRKMMSMAEPPTAVVFTDPVVAVGALNEAHRLRVAVPEDISILGFDDADLRNQVYPRMSAVCQDARRLGYEAFNMLAQFVTAKTRREPEREEFATWLEINDTTGPPTERVVRILPDGTRVEQ
jgi:DNA-binding LacI/PurR family transcriptional regulator